MSFRLSVLLGIFYFSIGAQSVRADIELPMGAIYGCPFIHDDSYDLSPLLETLKTQLAAEMNNKNSCQQAVQAVISNLAPLQDFYRSIDSVAKQRISQGIYANALKAMTEKKIQLELQGDTASAEYSYLVSNISSIENSNVTNEIDLRAGDLDQRNKNEAYYRTQLVTYTSNLIGAYNSTLRSNPKCIGKMGGTGQVLSGVLGAFSLATGLGSYPSANLIGAAASTSAQLVGLLKDAKIRSSYNDLIKLKNYKTLACTYFSIKKASCEYQRAYRISQDTIRLRNFIRNKFDPSTRGDYERFFVNRGRVKAMGDVFQVIAQMGSPLTINLGILGSYIEAKAANLDSLPPPPSANDTDQTIKTWLNQARIAGVNYSEYGPGGILLSPKDQLKTALTDIDNKRANILSAEALIATNPSFIDLRRKLSSDFPNMLSQITEMKNYLSQMKSLALVPDLDKGSVDAGIRLLTKLQNFMQVAIEQNGIENPDYELEVVKKGGDVFQELAKGSVAQLTKQSVISVAGKGVDRLSWAFGVIRNAYLNRDIEQALPNHAQFGEYQKNYNVLSDVISNYQIFSGNGAVFRDEEFSKATSSFEDGFKKEILDSMELAMDHEESIPELRGTTAAHLCALYSSSLNSMGRSGIFGDNRAARILGRCESNYLTLQFNRLVTDQDFKINYEDGCSYFNYTREFEIQNLVARLIGR